jgi:hypothetical protein
MEREAEVGGVIYGFLGDGIVNGGRRMEWVNVRSWMVDVNKDRFVVNTRLQLNID